MSCVTVEAESCVRNLERAYISVKYTPQREPHRAATGGWTPDGIAASGDQMACPSASHFTVSAAIKGRFSYNTYPIAPWLSTHSYVLAVLHPR